MSVLGEPLLDQERDTLTAIERLRQRAKRFQQLAAIAVTRNAAEMLTETSRGYAERAAWLEAKFITSRIIQ
jgi:hypothetical protein